MMENILITGGAGFIGANFVRFILDNNSNAQIYNLDLLTYAGSKNNLNELSDRHHLIEGDITDAKVVNEIFADHQIDTVVHFAAESHVDRSISGPGAFIQTNIIGTFTLLEAAREAWGDQYDNNRFLHVSTDEVYGSLKTDEPPFSEKNQYKPNSPYSASKAASDHLVRSYNRTYNMPTLTTNCSNNYGPLQYPEKLVPLIIINALTGKALPIYGDGQQVRDWLYVEDHCSAIYSVLQNGRFGEMYNIGGLNEMKNIDIVHTICDILDELQPREDGQSYKTLITYVKDRPGHDRRYAIDADKISTELNWQPSESFSTGIRKTIQWYLNNQPWVNTVMSENYNEWIELNYSKR